MPEEESSETSTMDIHQATLKNKRKVRGRITRSKKKRSNEGVSKKETNLRRFDKELEQLRNVERILKLLVNCAASFTICQT